MNKTERINEVLKVNGFSVSAFAKKIGMSQPTVDRYTKDGTKVSWEFAERILRTFPEISAEWLMRGEGSMLRVMPDVEKALDELNEPRINNLESFMNQLKQINERLEKIEDERRKI